ncbi:hypothetical protein GCM10028794_28540 [Silanimonas algicola]
MPIKKLIHVLPREPDPHTKLKMPDGSECWGYVDITRKPMPSGPIYFQYGWVSANDRGWGLKKIWKKRHDHHATYEAALLEIGPMLLAVLSSGTGVWFEEQGKVAAVSSRSGTVILRLHPEDASLSDDHDWWYSVTSFFPRTKSHGLKVGQIR